MGQEEAVSATQRVPSGHNDSVNGPSDDAAEYPQHPCNDIAHIPGMVLAVNVGPCTGWHAESSHFYCGTHS